MTQSCWVCIAPSIFKEVNEKMENKTIVRLYFTTCTTGEAVEELNIALKEAGYEPITTDNCIDSSKADAEDDWFEDYNFIFETEIYDTPENIKAKLKPTCVSFEILN